MNKNYNAPLEVRPLEKLIRDFAYHNGYELHRVFNDFLSYIIHGYSPGAPPIENWNYKKEDNAVFFKMMQEWILIMQKQIARRGWYDAFGELYISLIVSKKRQQYSGQFFTPSWICELMREIVMTGVKDKSDMNVLVSDPACGSGGTLLATHVADPIAYLCAEDIDYTCCMMTVCNFFIHGVRGEVIWHNSLDTDTYWKGWRTNYLTPTIKIPYIEVIPKEWSRIWWMWEKRRKEVEKERLRKEAAEKTKQQ